MITVNGHPFSFNIGAPLSRPLSLSPADIELCQWQQRQQQLRLVMGRAAQLHSLSFSPLHSGQNGFPIARSYLFL